MKIVILAGRDSSSTVLSVSRIASLPGIEIGAVILDIAAETWSKRLRNLRRNVRREGFSYLWFRAGDAITAWLDRAANRIVPAPDVQALLRNSFPDRAFSLTDLARRHGFELLTADNLNSAEAAAMIARTGAELGVVLGTRILKPSTFSVPPRGCINLHKGAVPSYRGMPPGFWELYDCRTEAGVTVHFVETGLDTGNVIGEASLPVHAKDTPSSLRKKLDALGAELLARCVLELASNTHSCRIQTERSRPARTNPTRRQRKELERRLGRGPQPDWLRNLKTLLYLGLYYSGCVTAVRTVRRLLGIRRIAILLYHRVNDQTEDALTTSIERFAEQMILLRQQYSVEKTSGLVDAVVQGRSLPATGVAIHFDDCYRDVFLNASAMLRRLQFPACAFISSGFVGTDRAFAHDSEKCPFPVPNLSTEELRALITRGFEIGAHTVNHIDLGRCDLETARAEVLGSRSDLEMLLGQPVSLFSYPFGRRDNIQPAVRSLVKKAGFRALFSAYGGYVHAKSDAYDIQRVGVYDASRPLDLLMEIEGLSLGALKRRFQPAPERPFSLAAETADTSS